MINWYYWQFYARTPELLVFILLFIVFHQYLSGKMYLGYAVIKGFIFWSLYCIFRYGIGVG